MRTRGPNWTMMAGLFTPADCRALLTEAHFKGWRAGTYSNGAVRPNVSVCFMYGENLVAMEWLDALQRQARILGELFRVEVWPERLHSIQLSHWRPGGDHYHYHTDHDSTGLLEMDRKLSIYVSLYENGGLEIAGSGMIACQTGDALAFSGMVNHASPKREDGHRYSLVAWVPGPSWT